MEEVLDVTRICGKDVKFRFRNQKKWFLIWGLQKKQELVRRIWGRGECFRLIDYYRVGLIQKYIYVYKYMWSIEGKEV